MKNKDIMDEDYGKEIDEPQLIEAPWSLRMLGTVVVACIAAILFALTAKLCIWLLSPSLGG